MAGERNSRKCRGRRGPRLIGSAALVVLSVTGTGITASAHRAHADPDAGDARLNPYPDLRYFTEIDAAPYDASDPPGASLPDQPGYWFTTAQGLSCGIWFRGSFGCSGDIPGAPAGVHQIGWISGDTRVHYDWTLATRFPPPRGSLTIPPLTFIKSEGTACGTTVDGSTYCERGAWRLLITATHTWLNG
jgi:hypothetical protein